MVNEHGQVLVIKEKYHENPKWKFPGGHADPGASIKPIITGEKGLRVHLY